MFKFRSSILLTVLSTLSAAVGLSACVQRSDGDEIPGLKPADIVVTGTGPTNSIARGENAEFDIDVLNAGPNDATNVRLIDTVGSQSTFVSITCVAASGAVCPSSIGEKMAVPTLPHDGSLKFTVKLKLADDSTGTIINSFSAGYDQDNDPNNNAIAADVAVR